MALTLSNTIATYGSAFVAIVQGRTGTLTFKTNPRYAWALASTELSCSEVLVGDTPVISETVGGVTTDYSFPITLQGVPSTLRITGSPPASGTFTPTISGGTPPYYLRALSDLPPGRSVSGLSVVGSYVSSGPYVYALEVSDSTGAVARLTVSQYVRSNSVPALALTFNDNTPLQFSDGQYLELAA